MTDHLVFEARLEARLRARAALASRPFDAADIAHRAVAADVHRPALRRLAWPIARPAAAVLLLALLLAIALIGVVLAGALRNLTTPQPPVVTNGWVAVSANPSDVNGGEVGDIYRLEPGVPARRIIGFDGDGIAQACPTFSPDGRRLAYGEARASDIPVTTFRGDWPVGDRAIVVVAVSDRRDVSASLMRKVVAAGAGPMVCPEWSPDGTALAVRVGGVVSITDAGSGATREISAVEGPRPQDELEWSRDGRRIAVAENSQIRIIRASDGTSGVFRVQGAIPDSLAWTTGDRQIVYVSTDVSGDGTALRLLDLGTREDRQLTVDPADPRVALDVTHAVVSPDATRLAYVAEMRLCTADGCTGLSTQILTMGMDGSTVVDVTPPEGGQGSLQWSPDGQQLLLGSIEGVISVAATPKPQVVTYSRGELNLEWSTEEMTWQRVLE